MGGGSDKLLKNTMVYAIGNFSSKVIIFALVPILTYFISREELGEYDLVQTVLNLAIPLFTLQISNGVYRWLLDKGDFKHKGNVINNGLVVTLFGWVLFIIIYLLISLFSDKLISITTASLLFGGSMFFHFFQFVVRGLGKTRLYAISGVINSIFLVSFTFIFLYYSEFGVNGLYYAIIVANFVSGVYLFLGGQLHIYLKYSLLNFTELKDMLLFSLPLIPNQISWWLISAADKFIILAVLSTEMNGIYAISSRFPGIMTLVNSVFILAWQDFAISDLSKNNTTQNTSLFNNYMKVQFSMVLLLIPLSEVMIKYLVDLNFYESYKYMPLLYLGVCYSSLAGFFGAIYLKSKNTSGVFTTSLIGGIVNLIITISFMKYIGLYASSIGTFVSFAIIVVLRIYQTKKVMPIKIPVNELVMCTAICLVYSYLVVVQTLQINLAIFFITLIGVIYYNKSLILKLKNNLIR